MSLGRRLPRSFAVAAAILFTALLAAPASAANRWNYESFDGGGVDTDGRTANEVGDDNAAIVWNNQPHLFYVDSTAGDLRHAWWSGTKWQFETLDGNRGAIGTPSGPTANNVGTDVTATVWNNEPHVFYRDITDRDLRHAWWDGRQWRRETLDGSCATVPCADGRTNNSVGWYNAVTVWNNQPHVFYADFTAGDLRHAWWTGTRWAYETLDGNSALGGRTTDDVGGSISVAVWKNEPHVWYVNNPKADLRHAWWNGTRWVYETLDGDGTAGGRTVNFVGADNAAIVWNNQPHVWYQESDGGNAFLRHAWWTGTRWAYETLDGNCASVPCSDGRAAPGALAAFNTVVVWNNQPHVWHWDFAANDVRHSWWTGSRWSHEVLDGNINRGGRVTFNVGFGAVATVWNNQPHVWYQDRDNMDLRHAWFGPGTAF